MKIFVLVIGDDEGDFGGSRGDWNGGGDNGGGVDGAVPQGGYIC